jgi:hypothetical protein
MLIDWDRAVFNSGSAMLEIYKDFKGVEPGRSQINEMTARLLAEWLCLKVLRNNLGRYVKKDRIEREALVIIDHYHETCPALFEMAAAMYSDVLIGEFTLEAMNMQLPVCSERRGYIMTHDKAVLEENFKANAEEIRKCMEKIDRLCDLTLKCFPSYIQTTDNIRNGYQHTLALSSHLI